MTLRLCIIIEYINLIIYKNGRFDYIQRIYHDDI
jgi:hypothetical protein